MATCVSPILVVDDDLDLRESIVDLLRLEGFCVAEAENGKEALAYLRANPLPCVILLDVMMPVMNGSEFRTEQLRDAKLAPIPVVLLTAAHDGSTHAERLAIADYFPKPIEIDAFLVTLHSYC